MTLCKKRVCACGDFLREGAAVVVRVGQGRLGKTPIPIELVAVGYTVIVSILGNRQVVGDKGRFLIEFKRS